MASHETLPDGTKVSTSANGTVLKVFPDGTKIQTTKEGVELTIRPDGTKEQKNARGVRVVTFADGRTIQTNPDGVSIEISADKKIRLQRNTDGSEILVRADGTKLQKMADGSEYEVGVDGSKRQTKPPGGGVAARAPLVAPVSRPVAAAPPPAAATQAPQRFYSPPPPAVGATESEQFSKVAAEHAKMLVRTEAEKEKLLLEKRDVERQLAMAKAQLDQADLAKRELAFKHETDLQEERRKNEDWAHQVEQCKQEAQNIQTEFDNYKLSVQDKDMLVQQAQQQLADLQASTLAWQQEQQEMQQVIDDLTTRLENSILGGSSAADKLAELKFARAMAEERANLAQEELQLARQECMEWKEKYEREAADRQNADTSLLNHLGSPTNTNGGKSTEEVEMLQNQKESLEMELEMQRNETARIQSELDEVMSTHNQSSMLNASSVSEVSEELRLAKVALASAEKLVKEKQKRIDQLESQLRVAKLEKEEIRLKMEMLDFPVSGSPSTQDNHRSARLQEEIDAEKKKRREKEDELDQQQIRFTELQTQISKLELDLETEKRLHEVTVHSLERERDELVEMAKNVADNAKTLSPRTGQEQKKSFFSIVSKKMTTHGVHGGSSTSGDRYDLESEIRELHMQVSEKERENDLLGEKIKSLDKEKVLEVEEVKQKLGVVEKRCEELKTELETRPFRTIGGEAGQSTAALEVELASLKNKLVMAEEKYNLSQLRTQELEEKIGSVPQVADELEQLQVELAQVRAQLNVTDRERQELQHEVARLYQERDRLVQQHQQEKLQLQQQHQQEKLQLQQQTQQQQQQQQYQAPQQQQYQAPQQQQYQAPQQQQYQAPQQQQYQAPVQQQPAYATHAQATPYTSRGSGGFVLPQKPAAAPAPVVAAAAPVAPRTSGGFVDPLEAIKAKKAAEAAAAAQRLQQQQPYAAAPAPAAAPAEAPAPRVNKLADRMKMFEKKG